LLKKDIFGEIRKIEHDGESAVLRDSRPARRWIAWLARVLLRRERDALNALHGVDGVPTLISSDRHTLQRSYVPGALLYEGRPGEIAYFNSAARLLRRIHSRGVVHNDLAKEANIIVREDRTPAFIDFQLAACSGKRGRLFRIAAREDYRHLLKHKRTYLPERLTAREKAILESPAVLSKVWMKLGKPVYLFVTRRLLGWSDREGAAER